MSKPGKRITYAVVELDTLVSLAKGAGWLDHPGQALKSDTELRNGR